MAGPETLRGIDWTTSWDKVVFDMHVGSLVQGPARWLESITEHQLGNGYYIDKRLQPDGSTTEVRKLKTMDDLDDNSPTDEEIDFNKKNPRITSKLASMVRDLALDELPQVRYLPEWSLVGPREQNAPFTNHLLSALKRRDKVLAGEFEENILYNTAIRRGYTSPGSLYLKLTNERSDDVLVRYARLELPYFMENATWFKDNLLIARTPPTLLRAAVKNSLAKDNPPTPMVAVDPSGIPQPAFAKIIK